MRVKDLASASLSRWQHGRLFARSPTPALQTKLVAADDDANLHGVMLPMLNHLGIELLDVVACSSVVKLNVESDGIEIDLRYRVSA
jgi:hypothetical protein